MKKLAIFFLFTIGILIGNLAEAQSFNGFYKKRIDNYSTSPKKLAIELGIQSNRSIRGWQYGWSFDAALNNAMRAGYFRTQGISTTEEDRPLSYGFEWSYLFNAKGRLGFGPVIKTIVTDKKFVSVVPVVQTRITLSERVRVKSAMGLSDRYPVFDFGLHFTLN